MPPGQVPGRYWIPALWDGEREKGWRTAVDPSRAPLYLRRPDAWLRMIDLPDLEALYVQFRSNFDEGDEKIAPFVGAVSKRLKSSPPKNLILDLRFDTGGDNTQNRDLMREIAQRVPGRIYLLVGNYTFSAGIASAAALKHDGGDKVTIVGDAVGDRTALVVGAWGTGLPPGIQGLLCYQHRLLEPRRRLPWQSALLRRPVRPCACPRSSSRCALR